MGVNKIVMLVIGLAICLAEMNARADGSIFDYDRLTALEKQALIWTKTTASPYTVLPPLDQTHGNLVCQMALSGIGRAFTGTSDEIQAGREKIIHRWGSAAKIEFVVDPSSPFTGLFHDGAIGVARLSLALPTKLGETFVPGIAIKFLVDGRRSKNIFAMNRLEGQGPDTNYFKMDFTNRLPRPTQIGTKLGTGIFEVVVENALFLNVDHVASIGRDGREIAAFVAPQQFKLKPSPGLALPSHAADFRLELAKILPGTPLYEFWGLNQNGDWVLIGHINTTSNFVASEYEDQKLYFLHQGTKLKRRRHYQIDARPLTVRVEAGSPTEMTAIEDVLDEETPSFMIDHEQGLVETDQTRHIYIVHGRGTVADIDAIGQIRGFSIVADPFK